MNFESGKMPLRTDLATLRAYQLAPPAKIRLDAMENPQPPPPAWLEALAGVEINRYPDGAAVALKNALSGYLGLPSGTPLLLGNGSDELLQLLMLALPAGASLVGVRPSFAMYEILARALRLKFVAMPLDENFELDLPALVAALERERPALVLLARPNNPTGNSFSAADIDRVLECAPGLVAIDEAYAAYAGESLLAKLESHPRLLLLGTLSKLGLAGLRVGWLLGQSRWLDQIDKLRLPYNLNALSQALACRALEQSAHLDGAVAAVVRRRSQLFARLQQLPLKVFPSRANFILVRPHRAQAGDLYGGLLRAGIRVRLLDSQDLPNCLRITVGTDEECGLLVENLQTLLAEQG